MNVTEVRALVHTSVPTIPWQHENQQAVATPGPLYMLTSRNVVQSVPVESSRSLQPNPLERSRSSVASNPGVQVEPVTFHVFKPDLPKPELLKFDGNPMRYPLFISNFEAHIASKLVAQDNALKLQYLIQHCQREAKQPIEFCTILSAEAGYKRARELLHANYGKPRIIARAHIGRLCNGAKIKPTDWKNLVKLSHDLEEWDVTLNHLGYYANLNNFDNLTKIVELLPFELQRRWLRYATAIEEDGLEAPFSDLERFVKDEA